MPFNHLRHPDFELVPVISIPATPRDSYRQLLEITNVADWTTLCISADVITTGSGINAGAALVQVLFYQLSGTSTIPTYNNTVIVGGRSLCTGISDQRTFSVASSLDVRLPIIAPFVEIVVYFPSSQTDITGMNIGAWLVNDPSYQYANPFPTGFLSSTISAADSILGSNNAGYLDFTRGILVPATTVRVVELLDQTIGKGFFSFRVEDNTGNAPNGPEVATWVCTKSITDTTGNTMDQMIHSFGNIAEARASDIPLVGFRQGVCMFNNTNPPRSLVWHWTVYPEFI